MRTFLVCAAAFVVGCVAAHGWLSLSTWDISLLESTRLIVTMIGALLVGTSVVQIFKGIVRYVTHEKQE